MIINRVWGMPNKFTFLVKPIKEIVERYVGSGIGWVDPFCGIIKICHHRSVICSLRAGYICRDQGKCIMEVS